jgi:hypothetical protein
MPVVGDWTGKGYDSIGTVGITYGGTSACPQLGWQIEWRLRNSNTGGSPDYDFCYGNPGDWPVVGNWNRRLNALTGSYIVGVGVARPNSPQTYALNWYLKFPTSHPVNGTADLTFT